MSQRPSQSTAGTRCATAGRAELSDEAVLNQHVNRVGSRLTG